MKKLLSPVSLTVLWGTVGCLTALRAEEQPNRPLTAPPAAKQALVDAALPSTPTVQPKQKRRLLITARTEGFYHESIPVAAYALQALGQKTGAFTADLNNEMSAFEPESLAKYDGVLFLSTTKLKFEKPGHRQALLDFVRTQGKGIIGIHAATDNFYEWPEAQAMMGGVFHSHPWFAKDTVAVRLDEPQHPLVRSFGGEGFWVKDEIYQIVGPYGRDKQRVVLSLDMSKPENRRPADKLVRTDGDFPIAWAKLEGSGRVFYSSLGHNEEIYWDKAIMAHFLDGIQFALGDLTVPTEVSSKVGGGFAPAYAPAAPTAALNAETAQSLLNVAENDEPSSVRATELALRRAAPAERAAFLKRLSDAPTPTTASTKRVLADLFATFGSDDQVPALVALAGSADGFEPAVQALGTLATPASVKGLLGLIDTPVAARRLAVINALGVAQSADAVPALAPLLMGTDKDLAWASSRALAKINHPDAFAAVVKGATSELSEPASTRAWDVIAASVRATAVPAATRLAALTPFQAEGLPNGLRAAAVDAALKVDPVAGLKLALTELSDPALAEKLIPAVVRQLARDPAALPSAIKVFGELDPARQSRVLAVAEQVGHPALRPLVAAGLAVAQPEVHQQALLAQATCARDLVDAEPLFAALTVAETKTVALQALSRTPIQGLDRVLRTKAQEAKDPALLASLLAICSNRVDSEIMPLVLSSAKASQPDVRGAAFKALASLVRGEDLDTLFSLRDSLKTAAERRSWQDATVNAIRFRNDTDEVVRMLAEKIPTAVSFERATYAVALVNLDTPASIAALEKELADPDVERRKEIIRALSGARIIPSGQLLIAAAEKSKDTSERVLALRGFLDVLLANPEMPIEERVSQYKRAWAVADRREEQGAIIAIVPSLWNPEGRRFGQEILEKYNATK